MTVQGAHEAIHAQVMSWDSVTAHSHRFGGTEFRIGRRELGHIHGDYLVDIPFPTKVRNQLVEAGSAEPHHILPDSGWISFYLQAPEDIDRAVALFKLSYELAKKQKRQQS